MNINTYRAWNVKAKIMRYNAQNDIVDITERDTLKQILGKDTATFFEIAEHDSNVVLMKYTGLNDEDAHPIFFDDIVIFTCNDRDINGDLETGTALIIETMSFGAGIIREKDPENLFDMVVAVDQGGYINEIWEDDDIWRFKVIGNRWQNPDLIKKINYKKI